MTSRMSARIKNNAKNSAMEQQFYALLYQSRRNRTKFSKNSVYLTDQIYKKTIVDVLHSKSLKNKKPRDWWLLARYDVILENGEHKIILPETEAKPLYYVRDSEIFSILEGCHSSVGHAGRDRMIKMLSSKYKNVIRQHVELFLQVCDFCQKRQKKPRNPILATLPPPQQETRPVINENEFNSRCQFDIIDFHTLPNDEFKYVLVYQDFTTKFIILRTLKNAKAEDVSKELLNIFYLFGAPYILQSGHGVDFTRRTIMHLRNSWDNLKVSVGDNVAKLEDTQDIENLIKLWMRDNHSKEWTKAVGNIQMTKNKSCFFDATLSPFQKVFKRKMRLGLPSDNSNDSANDAFESVDANGDSQMSLTITCAVCAKETEPAHVCQLCYISKTRAAVLSSTTRSVAEPAAVKRPTIWCTVYGCQSNSNDVVFFSFPRNRSRCIDWLKGICRDDLLNKDSDYISENHKICSKHFKPNMFPYGEKNRLLPTAYPQLSLDCEEFGHSIFGSSFGPEVTHSESSNKIEIPSMHKELPKPPKIKQEIRPKKRKRSVSSEDADSDEFDSIFGDFTFEYDKTENACVAAQETNMEEEIFELKEHAVNLSKTYNLVKKLISLELRRNNRNFNDSDIQSILTTVKTNSVNEQKKKKLDDLSLVTIKSEPLDVVDEVPIQKAIESPKEVMTKANSPESGTVNENALIKEEPETHYADVVDSVIVKEEINV